MGKTAIEKVCDFEPHLVMYECDTIYSTLLSHLLFALLLIHIFLLLLSFSPLYH